jgi:hypothetical protein
MYEFAIELGASAPRMVTSGCAAPAGATESGARSAAATARVADTRRELVRFVNSSSFRRAARRAPEQRRCSRAGSWAVYESGHFVRVKVVIRTFHTFDADSPVTVDLDSGVARP